MSTINLTSSQLRQAADLQEKIAALETELAHILGNEIPVPYKTTEPSTPAEPALPAKRTMSPAHKAKIRAAQAIRWAKYNATKEKPALKAEAKEPAKKKGGMSAAGKARIAAAQKLRWAKVKAGKTAEAPAKTEVKIAKKRKMSAAGRSAIAAGARARWAKVKAAKKA